MEIKNFCIYESIHKYSTLKVSPPAIKNKQLSTKNVIWWILYEWHSIYDAIINRLPYLIWGMVFLFECSSFNLIIQCCPFDSTELCTYSRICLQDSECMTPSLHLYVNVSSIKDFSIFKMSSRLFIFLLLACPLITGIWITSHLKEFSCVDAWNMEPVIQRYRGVLQAKDGDETGQGSL